MYKMVDSKYETDNRNSSKISIGTKMRNTEMLKSVPDYVKINKCVNMKLTNYEVNKCAIKQF